MAAQSSLDSLAFNFFREFARCEYCMKAVGLHAPNRRDPTADWGALAAEVPHLFDNPPSQEIAVAIRYYLESPPKKQVFKDGLLGWDDVLPDHGSPAELVLRLVCRARNNLFHGGKFNGHWFQPQRSEELLTHGLTILKAVVATHPKVGEAYSQKAV